MFSLPDLPYDFKALEPFIDEETMHLHHGKHHATYIKNLNEALVGHEDLLNLNIEDLLKDLSQVPEEIRTKVKNNGGGHFNHSLFWQLLSPKKSQPEGELLEKINSSFGSLDSFKEQFTKAGLGRFGSGWVWLIKNGDKLEITDTPNQDCPIMEGKTVILGLDLWEHAYYLKYKNMRVEYIAAFWNIVNWPKVAELLK